MAITALILFVAFMMLAGVVRAGIQWRRTGDTGDRRLTIRRGPVQWWVDGLGGGGAMAVGAAAPIAALSGLDPLAVLHRPLTQGGGLVVAALGNVATFAAQMASTASRRFASASSTDVPWLATSSSRHRDTYQSSSWCTAAVSVRTTRSPQVKDNQG